MASDDVIPHRQDKPPNRPYTPEEARQRMTVPEGFSVELVASEPDIVNPVAMTFDDGGRIWITESLEYPRKSAGPGRDRLKILEDTDRDGRADKFTTVVANLNIPSGVAIGYGGVWLLNAPDLLFLRLENDKEVSREVVVTGFGRADTHELPNSLTWGPDGWLYGLNGVFNPSRIKSNNGKEYSFTCAMWRVHPRTREFQVFCEGTSNPWGVAWDFEGSAIAEACHWANDHLFHFVETAYYQRQAGAYPPFTMKIGSITTHGHQKTAYCGISFFDSEAYPENFRGRLFVGNIHGGCINTDRLQRDGSTYLAQAEPDLLNANDAWFMPVALKVGPDGCLYVLDWYDRYHCYQDANRDPEGIDRLKGRLYRIRYKNTPRAQPVDLTKIAERDLVQRLGDPNIYFRETAQRLLTERLSGTSPSIQLRKALEEIVLSGSVGRNGDSLSPVLRSTKMQMHALWSLIGSGSLRPEFHNTLFTHSNASYRAWAVRAAGDFGDISPSKLIALARDHSPDVQLQVAIAARKVPAVDALYLLVDVLANCGHDKLIPSVVWPNLHPLLDHQADRFAAHAAQFRLASAPGLAALLPSCVEKLLSTDPPAIRPVLSIVSKLAEEDPARAQQALGKVGGRLAELREHNRQQLKDSIKPFLEGMVQNRAHPLYLSAQSLAARLRLPGFDVAAVRSEFLAFTNSTEDRLQALEAMVAFRDPDLLKALEAVAHSESSAFLTRVLTALGRAEDPKIAETLIRLYPAMPGELQPLAIELLLQREPWARKLLDAVQNGKLARSTLNANHLRRILESNDREAVWAVERIWGRIREERDPAREKVVAEMTERFRNGLGDPIAGARVFANICAQCHKIHGQGGDVGPDLTGNGRATFEQLLSNIFDPSLVIGPGYQVVTVVTRDGRNLTGLVIEDNNERMILKLPGEGQETVARNNVKYTRTSKLSMMPEGLESLVDEKQLSDLLAFLALDKSPTDPSAKPIAGAPSLKPDVNHTQSTPGSRSR